MPVIAILGASGLIGESLARELAIQGFVVHAVARRFTAAQEAALPARTLAPVVGLSAAELARLVAETGADIVVNCIGVLQDSARGGPAADAHSGFAARLVEAMQADGRPRLLVHVSVPGDPDEDATPFSRTKREAERIIAASPLSFAILRPGFVVADAAFGGSALVRALATLPFDVLGQAASRPFAAVDMRDITATVAHLASEWQAGRRDIRARYDLMERHPAPIGAVVARFRRHLGGPAPRFALPSVAATLGARAGDLASHLGWAPPIRTTALAEMQRGVAGDPQPWIAATGIEPRTLDQALASRPATVQERWFARLYLLKALIFGGLALFWVASGAIALFASFREAATILTSHGFSQTLADAITVASSLLDMTIGFAIAGRRTARIGLLAGIATSLGYMAGAAVLTPELWLEPLGALVKTGPAIILMLVALAILDER